MSTGAHVVASLLARVRGGVLGLAALTAGLLGLWSGAFADSAGASTLQPGCALSGTTVACVYGYTGTEVTWTVPAGVKSLHIGAVGGTGGENGDLDGFGGYGGTIVANVAVTGGKTLYIDVGGNGSDTGAGGLSGSSVSGGAAGLHYSSGGGGGGASAVQSCSANVPSCVSRYHSTTDPRLVIAGGGGGAGGNDGCAGGSGGGGLGSLTGEYNHCAYGGGGGNGTGGTGQWLDCFSSTYNGGGGGATPSAVGAGGNSDTSEPGTAGSGSLGGNGFVGPNAALSDGGGGGGGYYGGGGGGATTNCDNYGFGGGAGSSIARGTDVVYGNDTSGTPSVTISYKLVALSGLRVRPHRVSIAKGPAKLKVRYTLNTAARVKFTVRKASGHKVRARVVKSGQAGANHFVWKLSSHKLKAGRYKLTASPSGGAPQTVTFKIAG